MHAHSGSVVKALRVDGSRTRPLRTGRLSTQPLLALRRSAGGPSVHTQRNQQNLYLRLRSSHVETPELHTTARSVLFPSEPV
jgi:hypothetical protein